MKAKNYTGEPTAIMKRAVEVMFTQMNAKKGIRLFGERAIAAIYKEYQQLNEGALLESLCSVQ